MAVAFIGPSYAIQTRKADCQRSINLYLQQVESGSGKSPFILQSVPGLTVFSGIGGGEVRGAYTTTTGQCYAAVGRHLYRVKADGTFTQIGTLESIATPVEMDANTSQLVVVDGLYGYVVKLADDTFSRITSEAFYGSTRVAVIDGYALFTRPDTGQFYLTAINDAAKLDALDFATAEGSPDNLTAVLADRRTAILVGTHTTEGWVNSGDSDFPFFRDQSYFVQVGSIAPYTVRRFGNSFVLVGNSEEGGGVVYMASGSQYQRISTHAVEEQLQKSTDITKARAFSYQDQGHLFYCLTVPGLETQWVYDLATQSWHERAELVQGDYRPHRATCHTYAFGKHIVGAADGRLYAFDRATNTNAGDPLDRRRISPHYASPSLERMFFGTVELDANSGESDSGKVPLVSLRYSNDGGATWGTWRMRELGRIGEYGKPIRWTGNGSAYDRVWDLRVTDDAPFAIVNVVVQQ